MILFLLRGLAVAGCTVVVAALAGAQDGGSSLYGVPVSGCAPSATGCVVFRTELLLVARPVVTVNFPPYLPLALADELYGRLGLVEEPFSCSVVGDGVSVTSESVVVAPFVPLGEAVASGLVVAEYEGFLGDRRNYHVWSLSDFQIREGRDPSGWLPARNRCWFVSRYLAAKERWSLGVDPAEADALADVLDVCGWDDFEPACGSDFHRALVLTEAVPPSAADEARWRGLCDEDRDGVVTCSEANACGAIIPVRFGDPLYSVVVDADGDGVACR